MNEKNKHKAAPQNFWQKYGLLIVGGTALLFYGLLFLTQVVRLLTFDEIWYPLLNTRTIIIPGIFGALAFAPILIGAVLRCFFNFYHKIHIIKSLLALCLICFAILLFFMLVGAVFAGDHFHDKYRAVLNGHIYHVVQISNFDYERINIYECDNLEIRCTLVERGETDIKWSYDNIFIGSDDRQIIIEVHDYDGKTDTYVFRPASD